MSDKKNKPTLYSRDVQRIANSALTSLAQNFCLLHLAMEKLDIQPPEAIGEAQHALIKMYDALFSGGDMAAIMYDVMQALKALGEVTPEESDDEVEEEDLPSFEELQAMKPSKREKYQAHWEALVKERSDKQKEKVSKKKASKAGKPSL